MTAQYGRISIIALITSAILLCTGCSSYALRGRVVEGEASWVQVTDQSSAPSDPGRPVAGASVELVLDPGRLNRKVLGRAMTDSNGEFSIKVDEFGAGWLEHDVGLTVARDGFVTGDGFFRLPGSGKRVLVTLQRGRDSARRIDDEPYDYRDDLRRYGW